MGNMERYVKPALDYFKRHTDEKDVEFVEGLIKEIMNPVTKKHSSILDNLTSREIQIAEFIREGKTSKEIAEILSVTKKTVDFHRANIRKKLPIKDYKVNLEIVSAFSSMISDILQLDGKEAILLKAIRFPLILLIVVLSSVLIFWSGCRYYSTPLLIEKSRS